MKSIKLLGIAVVAVVAAMTTLGAASASATVLCKENVSTCSSGSVYASGTALEASLKSGTSLTLKSGILPAVTCNESSLSGKTTAEYGTSLPAEISSLTLSCQKNVAGTEILNLPYATSVEKTTGGNGTIALTSGGKGTPSIKFTKPFGLNANCIYGVSPLSLTLEGGNPGALTVSATLTKQEGSGGICPASSTLAASYEVTSPKPAFATTGPLSGDSVLCKEQVSICPASATYASGTMIETSGEIPTFTPVYAFGTNWSCENTTMSMKNTALAGNPLPMLAPTMTFSSCVNGCASIEAQTPIAGSIQATTGGNGTLTTTFKLYMTGCGPGLTCTYGASNINVPITGGNGSAKLVMEKRTLNKEEPSNASCASAVKISAQYNVNSPNPLWVEKAEA